MIKFGVALLPTTIHIKHAGTVDFNLLFWCTTLQKFGATYAQALASIPSGQINPLNKMGFEYKIKIQLSNEEKEKIKDIIPLRELKSFEDEVRVEDDGIYVVKYDRPDLWLRLDGLRNFIERTKKKYEIEEL